MNGNWIASNLPVYVGWSTFIEPDKVGGDGKGLHFSCLRRGEPARQRKRHTRPLSFGLSDYLVIINVVP